MMSLKLVRVVPAILALGLIAGTSALSAQSSLDTAEAEPFLGAWAMTLEAPDGQFPLVVDLTDANGKLAVRVGDGQQGMDVTNVTKAGEEIVARYLMDYQGMEIPVVVRLRKDGENVQSNWEFADGAYVTSAVGTRR